MLWKQVYNDVGNVLNETIFALAPVLLVVSGVPKNVPNFEA